MSHKPLVMSLRKNDWHYFGLAVIGLFLITFAVGCNLYRSSDRDYFDSNALSGAPKAALTVVNSSCEKTAIEIAANETISLVHQPETGLLRVDISRRVPSSASLTANCSFEFAEPASDIDARLASQSLVEAFLSQM